MIDRVETVILGDLEQKIHIKGSDKSNPILLFLHGGPGVCDRHSVMTADADLCDDFTIVAWDQRGTGGSYKGARVETLTVERLTEDAAELVEWLCREYDKDKIFVIGGSWGSVLGTWLCYKHPERIAAFIAYGQVVNGAKNEELSFDFALKEAQRAGDEKAVATLRRVGPPVMGIYKGGFDGLMAQRRVMMKYGGYSKDEKRRGYFSAVVVPMIKSKEYTLSDFIGVVNGYKYVLTAMWPAVAATDFPRTCTEFALPFFIFDGKLDMNTPAELVEDWYDMIKAPQKELIWFEKSGHNPLEDEPERFKSLLRDRLLAVKDKDKSKI